MIRLRGNSRVTYRTATRDDVIDYFGGPQMYTIKALAFFIDDKIAGIAGWKYEAGRFVVFSDIGKDVKISKQTIWRCVKVVMEMVRGRKAPMIAVAHNAPLCEKLGFRHVDGEIYEWRC